MNTNVDAVNMNQERVDETAKCEQEPVAIVNEGMGGIEWLIKPLPDDTPLYTAPPKREWVGLTENEFEEVLKQNNEAFPFVVYQQLEAKLKEKNG